MEYQVPQFIEVEDKIVGPFTLRQFIYIAGAGGLCIVAFVYLPIVVAIIVAVPIVAFGAALAFYRVNGKPFISVIEAGFNYYKGNKLLLWKQGEGNAGAERARKAPAPEAPKAHAEPRLTRGKLSELAWSLDVKAPGGAPEERES
ncbi:MAG TPA: PrgI family protein [Candidatus Paceibacterota bacterium]|nr:PrgI family protein [Candidatus Paceibacterota bacterium]